MVSASSLDAIFYNTFLTGLGFRFLIILYADRGLVVKGKPNLTLFNQIYWTCFGAFISLGLFYPISLVLQDKVEGSDGNKQCLSLPIEETKEASLYITGYAMSSVAFLLTQWLTYQSHRYLTAICPAKKMSCIGKFRRNIVSYDTNRLCLNIHFSKVIITPIIQKLTMTYPTIFHPKFGFWLNSIYFTLRLIICYITIVYTPLTQKELSPYKVKTFYVRKPFPEPKRDYTGDCFEFYVSVKRINPKGVKVKPLSTHHCTSNHPSLLQPSPSNPVLVRQPQHSSMPTVDWNMWHMWEINNYYMNVIFKKNNFFQRLINSDEVLVHSLVVLNIVNMYLKFKKWTNSWGNFNKATLFMLSAGPAFYYYCSK